MEHAKVAILEIRAQKGKKKAIDRALIFWYHCSVLS